MLLQKSAWLSLLTVVILCACRTEPTGHSLTPTIAVYAEKPELTPSSPTAPVRTPPGMVYVPGGLTQIGAKDGQAWEKPMIWAVIKPFFMDEHPVTVAEFRQFITATHYRPEADTFGDGTVLNEATGEWMLVKEPNWEYPQGRNAVERNAGKALDNHPVTQVSWNDATTYATWANKRLPSEFEWEHAARNAVNSRSRYPFGDELQTAGGTYLANTWSGTFPETDAVADGFHLTSPVGYYGKTPLGLTDMAGNVWQWCADWRQNYADILAGQLPTNPTERVQRGGSFLCEPGWYHGYRVSGRSFSSPETTLMHVGFRCVKNQL